MRVTIYYYSSESFHKVVLKSVESIIKTGWNELEVKTFGNDPVVFRKVMKIEVDWVSDKQLAKV